jgi:RHS repeat-associated protein
MLMAAVLALLLVVPVGAQESGGHDNTRERGFSADKVYQMGDIDSIDLATGNVVLTIPIGPSFSLNGGFSYGLKLTTNAELWNYVEVPEPCTCQDEDGIQYYCTCIGAVPDVSNNVGFGWRLSLGDVIDSRDATPQNPVIGSFTYVSPDGGRHVFHDTLHDFEVEDGAKYTRDGSYLRFRYLDNEPPTNDHARVEFPDGTTHLFELYEDYKWRLLAIVDANGNGFSVQYENQLCDDDDMMPAWTITDNAAVGGVEYPRRQQVCLSEGLVDHVLLVAPGGQVAKYQFRYYDSIPIQRPPAQNWSVPPYQAPIPARLLKEVVLPDQVSKYVFGTSATDGYYTCKDGPPSCPNGWWVPTGAVKKVTLPTGGTLSWTYQQWTSLMRNFLGPGGCVPGSNGCTREFHREDWPGIATRTMTELDSSTKTWTYRAWYGWADPMMIEPDEGLAYEERRTYVTDPAGNDTVHYFRAIPYAMGMISDESDMPESWDYVLPFTRRNPGDSTRNTSGPFLSVEYYTGAAGIPSDRKVPGPPTGSKVRSVFVDYTHDPSDDLWLEHRHFNRHMTLTKTVYHDDADAYLQTAYSNFDGLGHFRKGTTLGSLVPYTQHVSFTGYNPPPYASEPENGWVETDYPQYPGSYVPWPVNMPWILGTFDARCETEEDGLGSPKLRSEYCVSRFQSGYPMTGFVTRVRNLASLEVSPVRQAIDTVAVFTDDGWGNAVTESYHGGDSGGVGLESLCNATLPAAAYTITHSYAYGTRATSQYSGATYPSLNLTIDPAGVVTTTYDTAGIGTDLTYDIMGRLEWEKPRNAGAWTQYVYTKASGTIGPKAEAIVRGFGQTTGTPGSVGHARHSYDGFGRLTKTEQLRPTASESWNQQVTEYDSLGRTRRVSAVVAAGGTPSNWTTYTYDRFNRPLTVTKPDSKVETFTYLGDRSKTRTVTIFSRSSSGGNQDVSAATTETFDNLGRLRTVFEQIDATLWTRAIYGYAPGGQLRTVSLSSNAPTNGMHQTSSFVYDGRGFLVRSTTPETVSAGYPGCPVDGMCAWYDARGHVTERYFGEFHLTYTYDSQERLATVRDGETNQLLKEYAYYTDNSGADLRRGRLWQSKAHNYLLDGSDYKVVDTFTYADLRGRVTQKSTAVDVAGQTPGWVFTQSFTWDSNLLGSLARQVYPEGLSALPRREVKYTYTKGILTSVGERSASGANLYGYATAIAYHPNGAINQITRGSGVSETQTIVYGMPRPYRLYTSSALDPVSPGTANWDSGYYQYDGAGNIKYIGSDKYRYDRMSRVLDACVRGCTKTQSYVYDGFGNITSITTNGTEMPIEVTEWNGLGGEGVWYNAAGYLLNWRRGTTDFTYDWAPTGSMERYRSTAGVDREYVYDANDERVLTLERLHANQPPQHYTFTLRGLDQKVLREARAVRGYSGNIDVWMWSKDYVYAGGRLLADVAPNLGVRHMHLDHLGTAQYMTDSGKFNAGRHVYYPYGQEAPDSAGKVQYDTERMKFTGHERDTQRTLGAGWGDDLDYMHARYYNFGIGRFLSVDPAGATPGSTQSWNRYTYALDNPIDRTDPDGRCSVDSGLFDACLQMALFVQGFGRGVAEKASADAALGAHPLRSAGGSFDAGRVVGKHAPEKVDVVLEASVSGSPLKRFPGLEGTAGFAVVNLNDPYVFAGPTKTIGGAALTGSFSIGLVLDYNGRGSYQGAFTSVAGSAGGFQLGIAGNPLAPQGAKVVFVGVTTTLLPAVTQSQTEYLTLRPPSDDKPQP